MSEGRRGPALRAATWTLSVVALFLYFFQSSTLGVNHTDEGLIVGYIDAMAHGEHPFFDFVDAYGILNWVFPVLFYKAFGNEVFGIRMWMIVLKIITVLVTFVFARRMAEEPATANSPPTGARARAATGHFYAVLAAIGMTLLLGAQWQSLQTAYAFLTVLPFVVGAWYFILVAPFEKSKWNVRAAALLTAAAIWTKLNTGMFLLAGGLFAYFVWIPDSFAPPEETATAPTRAPFSRARILGAVAYGTLFLFFIRQYFNVWFFLFLVVPLVLGLGWSLRVATRDRADPARHLTPFVSYLATTAWLALSVLTLYYGKHSLEYVHELSGILSHIRYTAPFPELGKQAHYIGLNEYYWLELPWLTTAAFAVWLVFAKKRGPLAFGTEWPRRRAQVSALFVLLTLHSFVMYARADETHVYQMLVLQVPVLFVLLAQLESFLRSAHASGRLPLRLAVGGLWFLYSFSLLVVPTKNSFSLSSLAHSDWHNPKLAHLRYRRENSPYVEADSPNLTDHDWDKAEDDAAAYVKSLSEPGEEMLLLTANRLVYLNSDTRPLGGRLHFYFYLVSVGLLDREAFDALVPKSVIDDILERPPRIIVGALGWEPLAAAFPEFNWLRGAYYEKTRSFRHILVFELRMDGEPVQAPLR